MHHFAGLPLGARARVYLGITHQSFSRPDLKGRWEGRSVGGGGGVPAVPLCGPWQHLLMRDATHTLTCSLLTDLPSSLFSCLPFSTTLSSCRQSTQAMHQGMSLSPPSLLLLLYFLSLPLVSSVSGSLTSTLPHLPLSCCLLLTQCPHLFNTQHTLQKTAIKQTFLLVSLRSGIAQWLYAIYAKCKLYSNLQHP